jgi:RNA polymerase sigma-70 factor (ECF subfamily)
VVSIVSFDEPGLLEAARAGDAPAFDSLVGPLVEPAYKLAMVMLRNSDEAQDAVQEACLKAWRNLAQLRDANVRPWFFTIVANQCRSLRRARWWSVVRSDAVERRPDDAGPRSDDAIDLDRELARLPQTDRAVLFLFFYLDLPLKEVARVMRISPQAAKSRVHRAVGKLRLSMTEDIK